MLRRLLKYELQATARIFLPLYLLLFLMSIVNKIFLSINTESVEIPMAISMTAYISIIVAIIVITLVVTIQRFYKNLLTDEGYLMFTLPASINAHIASKLFIAMLWNFLSVILSICSVIVLAINPDVIKELGRAWLYMTSILAQQGAGVRFGIVQIIIMLFVSLAAGILKMYASMALGHLVTKHRVAGALGAYFLIGLVEQIVVTVGMTVVAGTGFFERFANWDPMSLANLAFAGINVGCLVLSVIFYFTTKYVLKNKLNLE